MASSDGAGAGLLDVIHGLFGTSLELPQVFRQPGTASIYQAYFGMGHTGMDFSSVTIKPGPTAPVSLTVYGISDTFGFHNVKGAVVHDGTTLCDGVSFKSICTDNSFLGASFSVTSGGDNSITAAGSNEITAPATTINSEITTISGFVFIDGIGADLATAINSKKGFDIPHPNKPNHRLRHICVEGPESAVYVRGRLVNSNIIELPDYWDGLVDLETISVNLTQIGHSQDLFVEKIQWGKQIVVKSGNGTSIDCFYQIWADRLGEKLIVEYEGKTPNDYPGDNSEYSLAGWNYDRRNNK
jgi:hypothetical protein